MRGPRDGYYFVTGVDDDPGRIGSRLFRRGSRFDSLGAGGGSGQAY